MEAGLFPERVARSRTDDSIDDRSEPKTPSWGRRTMAEQKKKRKPNPAFMKPMQPDAQLSAVVGDKPMPRTEVTKKIWDYIKKNNLQDSKNKRMINADEKLKAVFNGKRQVSMFEMTKLVNGHLKDTR
ncbi:MAG TPA: SWIB/MDM2 domain-containing protein [Gemmatimonadota bacterium]|nr:SWIB/MDM2 domain-containing protein [Gemmatimonadota bacterium]